MSVPEVAHSLSMNQRIMVIESKDESKSSVKSIPWHNVDEVPPRPKTESVQAPDKGTLQQCSIAQGTHLEVGSLSSVQLETLGVNMNSIARTGLEDSHQLKPLTRTLKPTAYCSPGSKSTIIHSDADTALQRRNLYKSLASFGGRSLPALGHAPSGCSVTNKTVKPPGQRSSSVEPSNQVTVPSELIGQRSLSVDADMMHSTQVDQQPIVISTRRPHIRPEVHLPLDIDRYSQKKSVLDSKPADNEHGDELFSCS